MTVTVRDANLATFALYLALFNNPKGAIFYFSSFSLKGAKLARFLPQLHLIRTWIPFINLSTFVNNILCFQYSNTKVERWFSAMNYFKSKKRKIISQNTVNSLVYIKYVQKHKIAFCENKYWFQNFFQSHLW